MHIKDVAQKLRVSPATINSYIRNGFLKYHQVEGGWRMITEEDLQDYLTKFNHSDK